MLFQMSDTSTRDTYNLLIGLCAPRPIAWVTTVDALGRLNAAPFSAYNYLSIDPPIVGIGVAPGAHGIKDTARGAQDAGEFVVNVVTEDLAEKMNVCAIDFPAGTCELEQAGLTTAPSAVVSVPRIAEAHAALECKVHQIIDVGPSKIILGRVVAMYVEDRFIDPAGPYVLAKDLHAIGRMNGMGNYVRTRDAFFEMPRIKLKDWQDGQR
jgi:flavin reductase (DIM6/NTAB) family NADH-FMN oxidoreductase RutF